MQQAGNTSGLERRMDDRLRTRREFTLESALAILSAATITITGCSDNGGSILTNPTQSGDVQGTVSANHGHIAVIRAAQLSSPTSISLDIRGNADHPHIVDLTAAEVTSVGAGGRVSKTSSIDVGHSHAVTFN
jgi:hypothetical protein